MGNIHLLIGDELLLKDLRINEILNTTEDYEYETFYMDSYKTENYNAMVNKINMFLGTYDFFSSSKVLKLVLSKPTQFNPIISKIDSFDDKNKLIIDLRCPEYLVKNTKFEYCGEQLKAEKFFKFKDYEKDKVGNYIKKCFKDNCINFKSDYDLDLATNYLFENSLNSYSFLYHQINKIKLLDKDLVEYDDITFAVGGLSDKNSYRICDYIFKSNSIKDIIDYLEDTLSISDYKMFSMLLNTLIGKLHDSILLNNGKMCKVKANYYTLKNSKIKIVECNELIIKLNKLAIKSKTTKNVFKEEFLLLVLEHIYI